jgi:F5/8 type C domain
LGVANGEIPDERITASSVYRAPGTVYSPWLGRAFASAEKPSAGCWRPAKDTSEEYLQVDLGQALMVSGIATQGQARSRNWITSLRLTYSLDNILWTEYPYPIVANHDDSGVALRSLEKEVKARYVRVYALDWHGRIALRLELYGYSPECPPAKPGEEFQPCLTPPRANAAEERRASERSSAKLQSEKVVKGINGFALGLASGRVPDSAITASSEYVPYGFHAGTDSDPSCTNMHKAIRAAEENDRLAAEKRRKMRKPRADQPKVNVTTGRFAEVGMDMDMDLEMEDKPFANEVGKPDCGIKVSFAPRYARLGNTKTPHKVGGWQPARSEVDEWLQVDLGSLQEVDAVSTQGRVGSNRWVTSYTLATSVDGKIFNDLPTVFSANADDETPVKNNISPQLARYVRFKVKGWSPGGIGLRVEIFGPGRGSGCLLRCFAASLARSRGLTSLEAQLAAVNGGVNGANAASFIEMDTSRVMSGEAVMMQLATAAGVERSSLQVSCCGCPCCGVINPGGCTPRRKRVSSNAGVLRGETA